MKRKSISFDAEVAAKVERQARDEERSFSQIVNRALKDAFRLSSPTSPKKPNRQRGSAAR